MTSELKLQEIQQKGRCNWCLAALINDTRELSESNFVETGRKFTNGDKAFAVYCNECIANETRVKQPKSAINKQTGDNIDIEFLQQQDQQQVIKNKNEAKQTTKR